MITSKKILDKDEYPNVVIPNGKKKKINIFKTYTELVGRIGLDYKPELNVIYATVSTNFCKVGYEYINKIEVRYKKKHISIKYSEKLERVANTDEDIHNYKMHESITKLVLDIIETEDISNTVDNEYIRYTVQCQGKTKKDYKIVLIEYNKKYKQDIKVDDFYNNVIAGITDWKFDKEANFIEEELIKQGRKTLNKFINDNYDLYDTVHNLSLLKYEGIENEGKMIICKNPCEFGDFIKFRDPISLKDSRNHRAIRKLLEICVDNIFLLSDGEDIYGICKIDETNLCEEKAKLFIIFRGNGCWELRNKFGLIIMNVNYLVPSLSKTGLNEADFQDKCHSTFGLLCASDKLWNFVDKAREQKHGTMIVISDAAKSESERLSHNSFPICTAEINDIDVVHGLTNIDGAVMLDQYGICYSIGCILDGVSNKYIGNNSRGARYNSALRYINYCIEKNINVLVVIVSEDGMVNIENQQTFNNLKEYNIGEIRIQI